MARDRRLDPALRRRLQALETSRSTVPMPRLAAEIRREIGSARDIRLGTRASSTRLPNSQARSKSRVKELRLFSR